MQNVSRTKMSLNPRAVTIVDVPTKGSRKSSRTEEEGDTGLRAVARVPDREVQDDTL